ncbi:MAG: hypothetical protein IT174_10730 [Acidobacteria bacterium]|nr:hypothetical protein [Acidobacteriota bacterium]
MSKKADERPAEEKPAEDEKPAEGTPAAEKSAAEEKPATEKKEKTYTKAEIEAERKKAVADAQKKWEEEKDLTELERIKKENEDLRSANRLRDARDEVVTALKTAGAKSAEFAFDAIQARLKFDDAGKLVNAKDLIDGLKSTYPDQFGIDKPEGGADGGVGQGKQGEKLTAEKLAAMTPAEINKLDWKEVSAVLAG